MNKTFEIGTGTSQSVPLQNSKKSPYPTPA